MRRFGTLFFGEVKEPRTVGGQLRTVVITLPLILLNRKNEGPATQLSPLNLQ